MTRGWKIQAAIVTAGIALCAIQARAGFLYAGRYYEEDRDCQWRISAGQVTDISGMVQETVRPYYDAAGLSDRQDEERDNLSLDDLDMDGDYPIVGLSYENAARVLTLQCDFTLMNPKADAVAKRNYYIGVGESIEYDGEEYDNMMIREGTVFDMEILGGSADVKVLLTPFTIRPSPMFSFVPALHAGIFGFGGQYKVDAGEPSGTKTYLNPPEEFVIGGESKGIVGVGLPEWGGTVEFRYGAAGAANLVFQGQYSVCEYDGSTAYFVTTQSREKDVTIEHENIRAKCWLELPAGTGGAFLLGAQYQGVRSNGDIRAQEGTEEELIERRERYNKEVEFSMDTIMVMLGLTF